MAALLVPLPGVAAVMGALQIGDGQEGIVLEGVERLVPEQFLDVVHVCPGPEQLGGAAPAQGMGGDVDAEA